MLPLFDVATVCELAPGAFHLPGAVPPDRQRRLVAECVRLLDGETPAYVPVVRGGRRMHVRMLCLGRHWNGQRYRYEPTRSDHDGRPAPPLPEGFATLARELAGRVRMAIEPDICLVNFYDCHGRMGLHQDKDESAGSIAAGVPVVSLSLGDTAHFRLGGLRRQDEVRSVPLLSGDAFIFGGPARLRYHGVARILAGTAPAALGLSGRVNLTFRQY